MAALANAALPLVLCLCALLILRSKGTRFDAFLQGTKEGIQSGISLLPTLIALLVAIGMFRASGLADFLTVRLAPICEKIGLPKELLSLVLLRPLSGGASTALASDLFATYGPDSFVGRCASVMLGSSDTVFYIIAVYFAAAGVKKGRHTVLSSLLTMLFCTFFSCFLVRLLLGSG